MWGKREEGKGKRRVKNEKGRREEGRRGRCGE
jgi:hypothetical protein